MEDLEPVYRYLSTLAVITRKDLEPRIGKFHKETHPARSLIFSEGDRYSKITFILKGLVKKYYLTNDGKEFIKEFSWENQITTPYASLLQKVPATYTMEAVEETTLLVIDYAVIESLFVQSPKWMELGKAFADFHFVNREAREMELLKYSAKERYNIFVRKFPHLLKRLKKQDIASYLGITAVSLSRLESKAASDAAADRADPRKQGES